MQEHRFPYPCQHLGYDYGGHLFIPMASKDTKLFKGDRGRNKEGGLKARMDSLECVSSRTIRRPKWILRQFKEETRRLSSAKSRVDDAEMAEKTPKLWIKEFLRHTLIKAKY